MDVGFKIPIFQWFIAAAIVLLMIDLLMSERKLDKS